EPEQSCQFELRFRSRVTCGFSRTPPRLAAAIFEGLRCAPNPPDACLEILSTASSCHLAVGCKRRNVARMPPLLLGQSRRVPYILFRYGRPPTPARGCKATQPQPSTQSHKGS